MMELDDLIEALRAEIGGETAETIRGVHQALCAIEQAVRAAEAAAARELIMNAVRQAAPALVERIEGAVPGEADNAFRAPDNNASHQPAEETTPCLHCSTN